MADIANIYKNLYTGPIVTFTENMDENGFISGAGLSGKDSMQVSVLGNDDRMILVARYDNLGKGASGAAIECMNIALGVNKTTGLQV
jgi:N-acetyl-gamma-glutamyl-phosphate reductase